MEISPKTKQQQISKMTQTNRFRVEIIKIIFKNLKCVLVFFLRIYFYFNLTTKVWQQIFYYNIL